MPQKFINAFDIEVRCPNCDNKFKISSNQVGSNITCNFCQQVIKLEDNGFSNGINEVNRTLDKFSKDLKKMFK